ncbi:MAG: transferrin receptor-like dimerization domain-containing protein [Acidobacteriota bacterium]
MNSLRRTCVLIPMVAKKLLLLTSGLVLALSLRAGSDSQKELTSVSLPGFSPERAKAQRQLEKTAREIPDSQNLKRLMERLAAEPHHLGSPYGRENAEFLLEQFRAWGFEASLETYEVLFPTPKDRLLELVEPTRFQARLQEPVIQEDPDSGDRGQLPTYNAFGGEGDVTAPLVYVNYGIPEDYEELARQKIDVRGKIVLARYGQSWRGIKVKLAQQRGALGCIIYSDPFDDGYYNGDPYPEGPHRPAEGVQRGSVMDMPVHPGDPLTPGWGSISGARRLARDQADVIMKIPVLPISHAEALPLLRALKGPVAPKPWRGALPVTYHIGPGPAKVRLKVFFTWSQPTLYNVIARLEGKARPNEWILYGNHHDGWVNGASDPVSGLISLLETARTVAELARQGSRPDRTLIFCAWDGEEPGLIGSTEWVETHAKELREKAVVYLNSDTTGKGVLGMGGSHLLEPFFNGVIREVPDPPSKRTVWESVREHRLEEVKSGKEKREIQTRRDLRLGALGAGSDYTPFIHHLGVSSLNIGFSAEETAGAYHSIYDSTHWYTHFSDIDFERGRVLSQISATTLLRLANAEVLPFDFLSLSETVDRYLEELESLAKARKPPKPIDFSPLKSANQALARMATRYQTAFRQASVSGTLWSHPRIEELNRILYQAERSLTEDSGLPRRPWYRHLIYAPGFYTGYGVKTLPGVREAIEEKEWDQVAGQIRAASAALARLTRQVEAAAGIVESR